jgi:cardiolipin synthase
VIEALSAASARGVVVELLLAGRTDHPVLQRAARAMLPRLLAAGVNFYEYERSMMHAKLAVFDSEWATVGTSNLDRQSMEHNFEVNLIVEGGELPRELRARFRTDLAHARRIDAEAFAARSWIERAIDRLAAMLLYLN